MDELEEAILKYLESRPKNWKWSTSTKVFTKEETIERFKKDEKFRKFIVERAHLLALEIFLKAAGDEGSGSSSRIR
jgi:hypothetical protein